MKTTKAQLRVQKAQAEAKSLWNAMCEHDKVDPTSKFVVFSKDNPFVAEHSAATSELLNALKALQAANARNKRARENRAAIRDVASSLGLKAVRGAVTGTVYYE